MKTVRTIPIIGHAGQHLLQIDYVSQPTRRAGALVSRGFLSACSKVALRWPQSGIRNALRIGLRRPPLKAVRETVTCPPSLPCKKIMMSSLPEPTRIVSLLSDNVEEIKKRQPSFFGTSQNRSQLSPGEIETVVVNRRQTLKTKLARSRAATTTEMANGTTEAADSLFEHPRLLAFRGLGLSVTDQRRRHSEAQGRNLPQSTEHPAPTQKMDRSNWDSIASSPCSRRISKRSNGNSRIFSVGR